MECSNQIFKDKVTFAIVIPAYGEPPFFHATLNSVLATQSKETRILVVDDASNSDFIEKICLKFSNRVTYFRNPKNLGISKNFNFCLMVANAEYVMLLGPDDILTESISNFIAFETMKNLDLVAIFSKVETISHDDQLVSDVGTKVKRILSPKTTGIVGKKRMLLTLILGNWTFNPSIIWKVHKLPLEPYSYKYKYAMDWKLLLQLSITKHTFYFTESVFFRYRRHLNSESMRDFHGRYNEERKLIIDLLKRNREIPLAYRTVGLLLITPRINLALKYLISRISPATSKAEIGKNG